MTGDDIERLKDDLARERLARRVAEEGLKQIKELLRPWWSESRSMSSWDGSLVGVPTMVANYVHAMHADHGSSTTSGTPSASESK